MFVCTRYNETQSCLVVKPFCHWCFPLGPSSLGKNPSLWMGITKHVLGQHHCTTILGIPIQQGVIWKEFHKTLNISKNYKRYDFWLFWSNNLSTIFNDHFHEEIWKGRFTSRLAMEFWLPSFYCFAKGWGISLEYQHLICNLF